MSKPSASKKFMPAGWVVRWVACSIVALAAVAAIGFAGSASLRSHRASASAQPVVAAAKQTPALSARGRVQASLATLPLAFEANQGQTDPTVKYMARGNGYTVFLTANDTVFAMQSSSQASTARAASKHEVVPDKTAPKAATKDQTAAIHMHVVGGNAQAQIAAGTQLPGRSNYFIGNDRRQWHSDVPQFARVSYRDVYPGVSLAFYGVQKQLEFDFIVAPGASAAPIELGISGAKKVATDGTGNLVLTSSVGDVLLHKPVAYQQKDGARQPVDARFVLQADNRVSFELGKYDHSRELVIDPSVSYATYLGGTLEDDAYGIAIDSAGDAYVTGQTTSTNFPTVSGGVATTNRGVFDAFVTKISADGSSLVYSTFVGGTGEDSGNAIAVDGSGNAFVAGGTGSSDFPHNGGYQTALKGGLDAFVFELNSSGSALTYSTYLGGTGDDYASGIALDGGNAYIVGSTFSSDFPTHNPIQSVLNGSSNGFVTELNSSGNALVYSTFLGGGTGDFASAVAVDSSGNTYVTGATPSPTFPTTASAFQKTCGSDGNCNGGLPDAFVTVINAAGSAYVYSTFLGGEGIDQGLGIAVDGSGDAYVTGLTQSSVHFPLKSALQSTFGGGAQDAFITELNPTGSALLYSTFLGGSLSDAGTGIALDGNQDAFVTGQTNSTNFPMVSATQGTLGGGNDAFVSEISASGSQLLFSTYLGGTLNENTNTPGANLAAIGSIAVDSIGANIYVAGNTGSSNFPATAGAKQTASGGGNDAFVAKYSVTSTGPDFTISGTALAAVAQGGSTNSTITIAALNGYTGTVNFTCSVASVSGGTPLPTCSIPSAVTGGAGTSMLTVNTTGSARAMNQSSHGVFYAMWLPVVGLSLVGIRMRTTDSRRKKLLGFLLLGLMMAALFFLPACSSSSGGGGGGCSGCTPTGTYTVMVTGTDSVNAGLTHSVSPALTLTVN